MEDLRSDEKFAIRDCARSLKKYGSTSKHINRNQNVIKHVITSSDTLQGIALKYGVTMEQIRRLNRLWASDSLFLREFLVIPLPDNSDGSSFYSNVEPTTSNNHSEAAMSDDLQDISSFLVKIDSSIANTKEEVLRSQGNSEFISKVNYEYQSERKKPAVSRMKHMNNNSCTDATASAQVVVMPQGTKIRSSLQRLAKEQDEIFEL